MRPWLKRISVGVIIASVVTMALTLPTATLVEALNRWISTQGWWGRFTFVGAYVLATLLLFPGSALGLAAGASFGLLWGTLLSSIASTTTAALAFLVARYAARPAVERFARRYPRFAAVDRAIAEGGWRIVALLRLSPAIPFSASNYLFGLTAVRFWPYLLTSWIAMLPGTFLYVYLGHAGAAGVAAVEGLAQRSAAEWAMLVAGLLATIAVTVYATVLARRRIHDQARDEAPPREEAGPPRRNAALVVVATLMAGLAVSAVLKRNTVRAWFGPPRVTLTEAYVEAPGGPTFDHAAFSALLRQHVAEGGWVDYEGLRKDAHILDGYITSVAAAPFEELGRNEKLALLINAYNASSLRLILDNWPVASIKDIPAERRFDDVRWRIGSHTWSLNQIEHDQIRPKFREPRIHFALVCAAVGCPPLRREAYTADRIEQQLEQQAAYVHQHRRWFRFDADAGVVHLTRLYDWYGGDFEQVAGSVLDYAARYAPDLKAALPKGKHPAVQWLEYDWRLNSRENAK